MHLYGNSFNQAYQNHLPTRATQVLYDIKPWTALQKNKGASGC